MAAADGGGARDGGADGDGVLLLLSKGDAAPVVAAAEAVG